MNKPNPLQVAIAIVAVTVIVVMFVLFLTGCNKVKGEDRSDVQIREIPVKGRTVTCLVLRDIDASEVENQGINCDWAGAK